MVAVSVKLKTRVLSRVSVEYRTVETAVVKVIKASLREVVSVRSCVLVTGTNRVVTCDMVLPSNIVDNTMVGTAVVKVEIEPLIVVVLVMTSRVVNDTTCFDTRTCGLGV